MKAHLFIAQGLVDRRECAILMRISSRCLSLTVPWSSCDRAKSSKLALAFLMFERPDLSPVPSSPSEKHGWRVFGGRWAQSSAGSR